MKGATKQKQEIPVLIAVSKKAGKAIVDFDMISEGDRIAVGVSGGKDSVSLMHILRHRQKISPVGFDFTAVHIDFGFKNFDAQVLADYLKRHGFSYLIEKNDTFKDQSEKSLNCFWCSHNRRKALFQLADREGFTKIAFGHHLDDIAETIVLNQFYRGEIGAMKPKQELFGGKIIIIRPLAYVREREMEYLAQKLGIDFLGQLKCGNEGKTKRMRIKRMLRDFELENPMVVTNIFRSLQRIKSEYLI
ncbi:MAG: tRNA 2-thiocytidine(32) synthetase TtcA [Candidatus Omnitrophica bacterium]|nr:tRNA 2-thiocytidine(32) synthetase TtcA [Candidatus Omnitrophota bacterium]